MILQGGATAVGGVMGGPAGAALGSAGGQVLGMGIDMLTDKPEYQGPSGNMLSAEFLAGETATEASMVDTASSREVARMQEGVGRAGMQRAQELNTSLMGLSPLDRSRVTQSLLAQGTQVRNQAQDALRGFLEGSRSTALLNKVRATGAYSNIATKVNTARVNAELRRKEAEAAINNSYADVMGNLVSAMANPALDIGGNKDDATALPTSVTPELDKAGYGKLDPASYGGNINMDVSLGNTGLDANNPSASGLPLFLDTEPYVDRLNPSEAITGQGNLTPQQRREGKREESAYLKSQNNIDVNSLRMQIGDLRRHIASLAPDDPNRTALQAEYNAMARRLARESDTLTAGLDTDFWGI